MAKYISYLFLLYGIPACNALFLNENEEKISMALIKKFQIRHLVLVNEPKKNLINLKNFKNFATWNKAVTYVDINLLLKYTRIRSLPDAKTMIIVKTEKSLSNILQIFKKVRNISKSSGLESKFCQFLLK